MLIVAFSKHPRQGDLIELTTKRMNFPHAPIARITKASSKGIYTTECWLYQGPSNVILKCLPD